ncbi:Hsp20/alpha crystallin family protein [Nonomuraea sp. CA-143628]|uniref:Hsp20/alpha crystallin family protein n=1 Tax=Nonomuraea sp. CA-143628 TaxID=3239997 RepID=UPI003D8F76CC
MSEAFVAEIDLPGVQKDDIDVEMNDRELVVTGEIKERKRLAASTAACGAAGASSSHVITSSSHPPSPAPEVFLESFKG